MNTYVKVGYYFAIVMSDGMTVYARIDEQPSRGMAFGTGFSEITPDGESGDFEIEALSKQVSRSDFEAARRRGFKSVAIQSQKN